MVGLPATPHPPSRKELHQPPCIPDIPPPPPPSVLPALEFLEGQCGGHVPLPTAAHTCPAPRRVTDSSSSFLRARIGARGPPRLRSPACLHLCLDLASWPPGLQSPPSVQMETCPCHFPSKPSRFLPPQPGSQGPSLWLTLGHLTVSLLPSVILPTWPFGCSLDTPRLAFSVPPPEMCFFLQPSSFFLFLFNDFIYLLLERGMEGEREGGKTLISSLLHAANWGPGWQPRHVP